MQSNGAATAPINPLLTSNNQLTKAEDAVKKVYTLFGMTPPTLTPANTAFLPVAAFDAGAIEKEQYFFHPDHLGSSNYITNFVGEVSQHMEYFAFGETFIEEHKNSNNSPYKFNGKELDDESGLYYYGARYYDPRISIWASVDPLAEKGLQFSPYCYTFNNPINLVDPNGKWPDFPAVFKNGFTNVVNGVVNTVKQSYNDTKSAIKSTYSETKKAVSQAGNNVQKWTKAHKEQLLDTAQVLQDAGDAFTITGGVIAVGTAATGVGIGVGATVAAYGEGLGLLGKGVELLTLAIAGDTKEALIGGAEKGAWMIAGEVADILIDRAIPGPTPDVSNSVASELQNAADVGNDLLKTTTKAKMTVVENAVSDKNK